MLQGWFTIMQLTFCFFSLSSSRGVTVRYPEETRVPTSSMKENSIKRRHYLQKKGDYSLEYILLLSILAIPADP